MAYKTKYATVKFGGGSDSLWLVVSKENNYCLGHIGQYDADPVDLRFSPNATATLTPAQLRDISLFMSRRQISIRRKK